MSFGKALIHRKSAIAISFNRGQTARNLTRVDTFCNFHKGMKSRTILKMAYVGSKTRLLGQVLEKTLFTLYRPHFQFNNHETWSECFLDEISDEFELGHVGSKTRSQSQMLEKPCVRSTGHAFSPIIMKLGQNFVTKS